MAAVENENLEPEIFHEIKEECEDPGEAFSKLVEEEGVNGLDLNRAEEVNVDNENISEIQLDPEANLLKFKRHGREEIYHLAPINDFGEIYVTPKDGKEPWKKVPGFDFEELAKVAHGELGIGETFTQDFRNQGFVFEIPPYLEEFREKYHQELHNLAQDAKNDWGSFIGSEGLALTQIDEYALKGEANSSGSQKSYTIEEAVELDYDIAIDQADENLPKGSNGLSYEQKERVFDAVVELAATAYERSNCYNDWEVGTYETAEREVLLYLENHEEQQIEVLGFEDVSEDDAKVCDVEIKEDSGYTSTCAREYFEDNYGSGSNVGVSGPLMEAAVNPECDRTNNGERSLKGEKLEVHDLSGPGQKQDKKLTKDNQVTTGSGQDCRLGGKVVS